MEKKIVIKNIIKPSILFGLGLGALVLLNSTEKENTYRTMRGAVKVSYEEDKVSGTISYASIEKHLRIMTFDVNGCIGNYLMIKDYDWSNGKAGYTKLSYVELKSGTCMLYYFCGYSTSEESIKLEPQEITIGENITILNEEPLLPYLVQKGNIKQEYEADELVDFFYEEGLDQYKEKTLERKVF